MDLSQLPGFVETSSKSLLDFIHFLQNLIRAVEIMTTLPWKFTSTNTARHRTRRRYANTLIPSKPRIPGWKVSDFYAMNFNFLVKWDRMNVWFKIHSVSLSRKSDKWAKERRSLSRYSSQWSTSCSQLLIFFTPRLELCIPVDVPKAPLKSLTHSLLDIQEGNIMIGVDDDTIFKTFEQEEFAEPSLRKSTATVSSTQQDKLRFQTTPLTSFCAISVMLNMVRRLTLARSCRISIELLKLCLA